MCRNIKMLTNFAPPATDDEIRASALQFVRKLSGMNKPSKANEEVFARALEDVTAAAHRLVHSLKTSAPPRTREEEIAKARNMTRAAAQIRTGFMPVTKWILLAVVDSTIHRFSDSWIRDPRFSDSTIGIRD